MKNLASITADRRFWAILILIPTVILAGASIAFGLGLLWAAALLTVGTLLLFVRYPEMPMTVLFPLMWLFWSYNLPLIGGRLERVIGTMAILGILIVLGLKRHTGAALPSFVAAGLVLFFGAYLISAVFNARLGSLDNLISLATRLLFLYLAFFHLHTAWQIRLAVWLLITTGLAGGAIILYWNIQWGLGFFRTSNGLILAQTSLGGFWYSLLLGGNSLTVPAVLLLGLIPALQHSWQRFLALVGANFLFVMAFFAQFRREILITVPVVLIYMIVMNLGGLRRLTIGLLVAMLLFYMAVLAPSPIVQNRIAQLAMISAGTDPRLISLLAGWQAFLRSPIIGYGPGSYESAAYTIMGNGYPSDYYHAYNVFIYFAVESGFLGLGGVL